MTDEYDTLHEKHRNLNQELPELERKLKTQALDIERLQNQLNEKQNLVNDLQQQNSYYDDEVRRIPEIEKKVRQLASENERLIDTIKDRENDLADLTSRLGSIKELEYNARILSAENQKV